MRRTLAAAFGLCLFSAAPAHASVTDLVDRIAGLIGRIPRAPGATSQSRERRLVLNGQVLRLITGHARAPLRAALDFYEKQFGAQARAPRAGLRMIGLEQIDADAGYRVLIDPMSREAALGVVRDDRPVLSAGPLRMVYAQRRGDGSDYLVLWTDAPFDEDALGVEGEDAPGQDAPGAPRPPASIRGLNLFEPAAGYGIVTYALPSAPSEAEALRAARARLLLAGFVEDADLRTAAAHTRAEVAQFHAKDRSLLVSARARRDRPGCEVTYLWRAQ